MQATRPVPTSDVHIVDGRGTDSANVILPGNSSWYTETAHWTAWAPEVDINLNLSTLLGGAFHNGLIGKLYGVKEIIF